MRRVEAASVRRIILEESKRADVGHVGSALSVADIMAVLYDRVLRIPSPRDPDRDRFLLSKGHAAIALYAALFLRGWLTRDELQSFCTDGSRLGVHPDCALDGVDFSTGSLGHGLPLAVGAALAARLARSDRRVFVLVSDGECNEGSLWEAAMFAAHHRLANLVAIVDLNGQQALGYTRDVLDLSPMRERWRSFGWDAHDVDGHDAGALAETLEHLGTSEGAPHAIVAHTVFGKGVSFMEGQLAWHYQPMTDANYLDALRECERRS